MNDKNADEARGVKGRIEKTLLGEVWGEVVNCGSEELGNMSPLI